MSNRLSCTFNPARLTDSLPRRLVEAGSVGSVTNAVHVARGVAGEGGVGLDHHPATGRVGVRSRHGQHGAAVLSHMVPCLE